MATEYSYYFTEKAENDLDSILRYISGTLGNPSAARSLLEEIFSSIEALTACPYSGKLVNNRYLSDRSVRRVLVENYVIYYKTDESKNVLYVVRIAYGKRDGKNVFKDLT